MLPIRKLAFFVAGAFLCIFVLIHQYPTRLSEIQTTLSSDSHDAPETEATTESSPSSSTWKSKDEIERILEGADRPSQNAEEFSRLRDHLERLFPYEGTAETGFPAYIWQTWKSTPAMEEFDERFRAPQASWTERHPDYVHKVSTQPIPKQN